MRRWSAHLRGDNGSRCGRHGCCFCLWTKIILVIHWNWSRLETSHATHAIVCVCLWLQLHQEGWWRVNIVSYVDSTMDHRHHFPKLIFSSSSSLTSINDDVDQRYSWHGHHHPPDHPSPPVKGKVAAVLFHHLVFHVHQLSNHSPDTVHCFIPSSATDTDH